jgi:hypothetical protein
MALLTLGLILCAGRQDSDDGASLRGGALEAKKQEPKNKLEIPSMKNDLANADDEDGHQQLSKSSLSSSSAEDESLSDGLLDEMEGDSKEDVEDGKTVNGASEEPGIDHGGSHASTDDVNELGKDSVAVTNDRGSKARSEDLDDSDDESRKEEDDDVENSQDRSALEPDSLPEEINPESETEVMAASSQEETLTAEEEGKATAP